MDALTILTYIARGAAILGLWGTITCGAIISWAAWTDFTMTENGPMQRSFEWIALATITAYAAMVAFGGIAICWDVWATATGAWAWGH